MTIKYPNLIQEFPDDIVEQAYKKIEEGDDEFKQFMLQHCHLYALNLLNNFWYVLGQDANVIANSYTLDNLEEQYNGTTTDN